MFIWNGKEYRNIQEQVKKNMEDITELIKKGYKGYTAGENIHISDEGVISATDTTYAAGDGINISDSNTITLDMSFVESYFPSYNEGTGITITYDSENNQFMFSVDTSIATKNYVTEKIAELPKRYLHRLYVHTDGGNQKVAFNVITDSSTAWSLGNLPKSLTIAVDVLNADWDMSNMWEWTLITNAAGDDMVLEDQSGARQIDFEGLISVHDRVQPL